MALPIVEGGVLYGTPKLTIDGDEYICENASAKVPTWRSERQNENGVVNGRVLGAEPITYSATLLYSATVTAAPAIGGAFTTAVSGVGNVDFIIDDVGTSEGQREMKKCSITAVKSAA